MNNEKTICIGSFATPDLADMYRLELTQTGIQSYLGGDLLGATHYNHADGGIKLYVLESDAQEARELINRACDERRHSIDLDGPAVTRWDTYSAVGLFVIVMLVFGVPVVHLTAGLIEAIVQFNVLGMILYTGIDLFCVVTVFYALKRLINVRKSSVD